MTPAELRAFAFRARRDALTAADIEALERHADSLEKGTKDRREEIRERALEAKAQGRKISEEIEILKLEYPDMKPKAVENAAYGRGEQLQSKI